MGLRVTWVAWVWAAAAPGWGQPTTAILGGTVTDPVGRSVPGAKVTLSNSDTGFVRPFLTQESGQFVFPLLAPGHYQMRVERAGFRLCFYSDIALSVGQSVRLDPMLEISSEQQVVVVEGKAQARDGTGDLALTLGGEALHDLPMQGQGFLNLAGAAPGVVGRGSAGDFDNFAPEKDFDLSANGRNSSGNLFLLDGLNVTSNIVSGVTNLSPNPESISELTVQTNTFTVEQGRSSSIQVAMTSQGGTNSWHGAANYLFTDQYLEARTVFTGHFDPFKKHNLAAALGGPLVRNRMFLFASTQLLRSSDSLGNGVQTYESPEFVAWAQTAYPNAVGTRAMTEAPVVNLVAVGVAARARDVLGAACGTPASLMLPCDMPMIAVGQSDPTTSRDGLQYNARVDRYFRDNRDRVFGNYYRTTLDLGNPVMRAGMDSTSAYGSRATEVAWVRTISSSVLNEASFSGIKVEGDQVPRARYHIPDIDIPGQSVNISAGWGGAYAQHNYNWRDVLTWVRGRHLLKAGGNYYLSDDSADFTRTSTRPVFTFANLLDLVRDRPLTETGLGYDPLTGQPAGLVFGGKVGTGGLFVQDDWAVTPHLNLTLGFRWDDFGNPTGTHGMQFSNLYYGAGNSLDAQVANGTLRVGPHPYPHSLDHNLGPRAGFAWAPRGSGNWRIHGGIGLYQDWVPLGQPVDLMRQNPPNYLFPTFRSDGGIKPIFALGNSDTYPFGFPLPQIPTGHLDAHGGLVGARPDIGFVSQNLSSPHTLNYLAGVDRKLPAGIRAGANYSGSYTPDALLGTDLNRTAGGLLSGSLNRLNPSFGAMNAVWNGNVIHYSALIVTVRKDLGSGLLLQASYTLSKTTDYVQAGTRQNRDGPYSIPDQHNIPGLSSYADWDARHRFSFTGLWHVPGPATGHVPTRLFLDGWELSSVVTLQSGTPFTVVNRNPFDPIRDASGKVIGLNPDSGDYNADGYNYDFPNAPVRDFTGSHTRAEYLSGLFRASDFPAPAPGTQGNLKRNIYRNPGLADIDLGLIKNNHTEALGAHGNIQVRVEVFNAPNRVNLQGVDNNMGSATFGRSTAANPARTIQVGLRLLF